MYEPGHLYTLYDEFITEIPFPDISPTNITVVLPFTFFQESVRDSACDGLELSSKRDKILCTNNL